MKPVQVHTDAEVEADEAFEWYWNQSYESAVAFDQELRSAYSFIQTHPKACSPYMLGTRRILLDRFPFSIIFRERLHDIQIIAIAHAKRRPGYWLKRLKQ